MTSGNEKITPFQFYGILFLSRFFTNMTYIASLDANINAYQAPLMIIISTVIVFICAVPVYLLLKSGNGEGIIKRSENINKGFSKTLCFVFMIIYIFYCIIATARFEIFASSVMFPRSDVKVFLFFIMCVCVFCAYRGFESTARASFIFICLLIASFTFIIISLFDKFDILNMGEPETENYGSLIKTSFFSVSRTAEISTIPFVVDKVKGKLHNGLFKWIIMTALFLMVIVLSVSFVLGDFGYSQMFSTYTLSILVKVGVIEKLDAVIASLWILCFLTKMSYMFIIIKIIVDKLIPKSEIVSLTVIPVIVYTGAIIVSYSVLTFEKIILSSVSVVLFVSVTVVLPFAVYICDKIKNKKMKGVESD